MFKKLLILPLTAVILVFAGCEAQKNNATIESAIAEAKAAADNKEDGADANAEDVSGEVQEQAQALLRSLDRNTALELMDELADEFTGSATVDNYATDVIDTLTGRVYKDTRPFFEMVVSESMVSDTAVCCGTEVNFEEVLVTGASSEGDRKCDAFLLDCGAQFTIFPCKRSNAMDCNRKYFV